MTFRRRALNKELFKSSTQIYNQTKKMHAWFAAYDLLILRLRGLNRLIASKFVACSGVSEKSQLPLDCRNESWYPAY